MKKVTCLLYSRQKKSNKMKNIHHIFKISYYPHIFKISCYQSKYLASICGWAINMIHGFKQTALSLKENRTDVQYCHHWLPDSHLYERKLQAWSRYLSCFYSTIRIVYMLREGPGALRYKSSVLSITFPSWASRLQAT